MKKLLALLLAMVMLLCLPACVSDDEDEDSKTGSAKKNSSNKRPVTFQETLVVDNEVCTIKVTDVDPDNSMGFTISVYLENKTDKKLQFELIYSTTNGVTNDPLWMSNVDAGKKANEEIYYYSIADKDLTTLIGDYTDIALTFQASDAEDYWADPLTQASVHIYPYGEDKATTFVRQSQSSDQVLIDNEHLTVIVTDYQKDDFYSLMVNLYIVNKTDSTIWIESNDTSVNGFMCDPYFMEIIYPNTGCFTEFYWTSDTLKDNKIDKIEEIEMTLVAQDHYNYSIKFAEETVTLHP